MDADEITRELDRVEANISKRGFGKASSDRGAAAAQPIIAESLDLQFEEVKGAIRAKAPYAYYAVLFASYASRLRFPREVDARPVLIAGMRICVSNMRAILPPGSFDIVDDDLGRMTKAPPGSQTPPTTANAADADRALKHRIQVWSDLVFGTMTVYDTLNRLGRVLHLLSIVGAGLALFLVVGGIIVLVFNVIQVLPGFSQQALNSLSFGNVSSFIMNVVPLIAALGLSVSLLATKAWDAVKTFDLWVAVQLAKLPRLRRQSVYTTIS